MKTFDFDVSSSHVSINISIVRFLVGKTLKVVIHVPYLYMETRLA